MKTAKQKVHDFWNRASCGEELYLAGRDTTSYKMQAWARYDLEPQIFDFARFESVRGLKVLEIGVGLGADHQIFAQSGAKLTGIDLTQRAVEHTVQRLAAFDLNSHLSIGDAERLAFRDESFDLVWAWGVLHHTPDTERAIEEIWRVLRINGVARVMIYHKYSLVGLMLWLRYGLMRLRPWTPLEEIYAQHLESPGTKAYSVKEAGALFSRFSNVNIQTMLSHGDLLESAAGQRHRGVPLFLARQIWPRWLIRRAIPQQGLFMLVEAYKL